jgi:hypothetical protein
MSPRADLLLPRLQFELVGILRSKEMGSEKQGSEKQGSEKQGSEGQGTPRAPEYSHRLDDESTS